MGNFLKPWADNLYSKSQDHIHKEHAMGGARRINLNNLVPFSAQIAGPYSRAGLDGDALVEDKHASHYEENPLPENYISQEDYERILTNFHNFHKDLEFSPGDRVGLAIRVGAGVSGDEGLSIYRRKGTVVDRPCKSGEDAFAPDNPENGDYWYCVDVFLLYGIDSPNLSWIECAINQAFLIATGTQK